MPIVIAIVKLINIINRTDEKRLKLYGHVRAINDLQHLGKF